MDAVCHLFRKRKQKERFFPHSIRCTARWSSLEVLKRLLYATRQHTCTVRSQADALAVLTRCMNQQPSSTKAPVNTSTAIGVMEDLLTDAGPNSQVAEQMVASPIYVSMHFRTT